MTRKKQHSDGPRLFKENLVPADPGSDELFKTEYEGARDDVVECLGMTFPNDGKRREFFIEKLREKLKDPEFRKIEGFPVGADEDILALSDPPYYTACPNPWLSEFIESYGTPYDSKQPYHREPFAADVSEGKNHPIYNAHSYHTKVPHRAIMRYILHYTEPGDVVFDGFCGTGMTGVAAQLCGSRAEVQELGYRVQDDGTILDEEGNPFSKLGARRAILNDLSPAATFIAYNYNAPVDVDAFEREAERILKKVQEELGWMYETKHTDGTKQNINFTVWSDVFTCSECGGEIVFWDAAVDQDAKGVREELKCPQCGALSTKRGLERAFTRRYDKALATTVTAAKTVPVLINYSVGSKRYQKAPDAEDLALVKLVSEMVPSSWFPTNRLREGGETRRNDLIGITHAHHFYTHRNLIALSAVHELASKAGSPFLFWFTATLTWVGRENRLHLGNYFGKKGGVITSLRGTWYVASLQVETCVFARFELRMRIQEARSAAFSSERCAVSTQSSSLLVTESELCDYVFIDPPFGSNLMYSELNALWEAWLRVETNNSDEAVEDTRSGKTLLTYKGIMDRCFAEAFRILKPGRWMTVEFSNTAASVWNVIQTSFQDAGFVVANVSALDKQKGSFKAVTTPTAVKQDLVISAYKPNGGFEERFGKEASSEEGVWDFVRTHLKYLPVTKQQGAKLQFVPERDPRILYDQMVAYYVRKGFPVPMNSYEFQAGLAQRFIPRDGMFFRSEQAAEYDRKKMQYGEPGDQWGSTVVDDEQSAISWLMARLKQTPQPYNEIQPDFMPMLSHLKGHERDLLSLDILLADNFLCYDGTGLVPEQIHSYLSTNWKNLRNLPKDDPALRAKAKDRWYVPDPNKVGDLEKLRERSLLKEFEDYRTSVQKRLKVFRLEAVRAGFKKAWQDRDYDTIVNVAQKIPEDVLQEDSKLLMWYDQALTRKGDAQ